MPKKKRNKPRSASRAHINKSPTVKGSGTDKRVERAHRVRQDMSRDPFLAFTAATRKRGVDPRWVQKHFSSWFQKDSSGRIKLKPKRKASEMTLYIPSAEPGVSVPVVTKSKSERRLVGQWMAALNAAGRGDFSKVDAFPRGQVIGGVLLTTNRQEIQQILIAMAEQDEPFEGLYRMIARPS